ncbi:hypothetical protein [Arenibaculum sp.]|jgi:hypothetical protein|uniref:hypothetical protein n=1 Tax=Arenibaculum sp. TaxID=2865862 RepID=UPI002E160908|nr:hypothetical protein [Arenibaculum sp.]
MKYLAAIAAGAIGLAGAYAGTVLLLEAQFPQHLPAPSITRIKHLDEKLLYLRERGPVEPALLAVGSSITWRQMDGDAFAELAGGADRVFNGATAFLQAHQTRFLTEFYLDHFSGVETVLVMVALPDFSDCTGIDSVLMDTADAVSYAFEGKDDLGFYFKYFTPLMYLKRGISMAEQRQPLTGEVYLDEYGSSPIDLLPGTTPSLRYGELPVDDACIAELAKLSAEIDGMGKEMALVFAPVHPAYWESFPAAREAWRAVAERITEAVAPHGTRVLDLAESPAFKAEDFFDAFHLRWPSVARFSTMTADWMRDRHHIARAPAERPTGMPATAKDQPRRRPPGVPASGAFRRTSVE